MARDFYRWLKTFTNTIRNNSYWVDWEKVVRNVNLHKDELNILNGIIGVEDIEQEFKRIVTKYPNVIKCIPILIAVRSTQIEISTGIISFNPKNFDIDEVCIFMKECGLFKILQDKSIKNLVDYLTGIEVGLDSNARKNRGGTLMADKFENFLKSSGIAYNKEMNAKDVQKKYDINLSALTNSGKTVKRFDFVFKINEIVYGVEVNFYSTGGSKLNETARSYKQIAQESKAIENFRFMWITDGAGWADAKNNLKETFEVLDNLYNINNLKNGVLDKLSEWTEDIYDEIDVLSDEDAALNTK